MKPIIVDSMNAMKKLGGDLFHYKDTKELAIQALAMKRKGKSLRELREHFGKSRITIWRWLELALAIENHENKI